MEITSPEYIILYVSIHSEFHIKKKKKVEAKIKRSVRRKRIECVFTAPLSLSATSGDIDGEIDLIWEPVSNANTYIIQKCSGSVKPLHWVNLDIVAKSSYTVSRLKSKNLYRFRVAAVNDSGQSEWSRPVQKKSTIKFYLIYHKQLLFKL